MSRVFLLDSEGIMQESVSFLAFLEDLCYLIIDKSMLLQSGVYKYLINNHLSFTVMYHRDPETGSSRIVGFEVTPNRSTSSCYWTCEIALLLLNLVVCHHYLYYILESLNPKRVLACRGFWLVFRLNYSNSIKYEDTWDGKPQTCNQNTENIIAELQEVDTGNTITFSYDVTYKVFSFWLALVEWFCFFYKTHTTICGAGKWNQVGIKVGCIPHDEWWSNPLVFNRQLIVDRSLSFWCGCYDHDPNSLQGHCKLQSIGNQRRSSRRNRMEAGSRRCFQATSKLRIAVCLCRNWSSDIWNDTSDNDLCAVRLPLSFQPRGAHDCHGSAMGFHGVLWRLFICSPLQNVQRHRVEKERLENGSPLSRYSVSSLLRAERSHLGRIIFSGRALWNNACSPILVVWNLSSISVCWRLFWIQKGYYSRSN